MSSESCTEACTEAFSEESECSSCDDGDAGGYVAYRRDPATEFASYARESPFTEIGRMRRADAAMLAVAAKNAATAIRSCYSKQTGYLGSPPGHSSEFQVAVTTLQTVVATATAAALNVAGGKARGAYADIEAAGVAAARILTNLGPDTPLGGCQKSTLLDALDSAAAALMASAAGGAAGGAAPAAS